MNLEIEKQKLKIAEMELEVEKQRLNLMELELVKTTQPVKLPVIKPKLDKINFCKTNSKPYEVARVTQNGVIYTTTGYRLKINMNDLPDLKERLPNILKKRNTPNFWTIVGKKFDVSANCIERIIFNLVNGAFDEVITKWNDYHLQFNEYGEVTGGN